MFNRVQPVLGDAETDVEAQQEENAVALTKDINNEDLAFILQKGRSILEPPLRLQLADTADADGLVPVGTVGKALGYDEMGEFLETHQRDGEDILRVQFPLTVRKLPPSKLMKVFAPPEETTLESIKEKLKSLVGHSLYRRLWDGIDAPGRDDEKMPGGESGVVMAVRNRRLNFARMVTHVQHSHDTSYVFEEAVTKEMFALLKAESGTITPKSLEALIENVDDDKARGLRFLKGSGLKAFVKMRSKFSSETRAKKDSRDAHRRTRGRRSAVVHVLLVRNAKTSRFSVLGLRAFRPRGATPCLPAGSRCATNGCCCCSCLRRPPLACIWRRVRRSPRMPVVSLLVALPAACLHA